MRYIRRLRFTKKELLNILGDLDGYIWATIDARRGLISAGNDFIPDMRDDLLLRHSKTEDIYGVGINLETGEVDFIKSCNRRNPTIGASGRVSADRQERILTLVHYFFGSLQAFSEDPNHPRYSRKPVDHE